MHFLKMMAEPVDGIGKPGVDDLDILAKKFAWRFPDQDGNEDRTVKLKGFLDILQGKPCFQANLANSIDKFINGRKIVSYNHAADGIEGLACGLGQLIFLPANE